MEIWQRRVIVADEDLDFDHLEITLILEMEPDLKLVKKFPKK
jgi:N utilization substance protein A